MPFIINSKYQQSEFLFYLRFGIAETAFIIGSVTKMDPWASFYAFLVCIHRAPGVVQLKGRNLTVQVALEAWLRLDRPSDLLAIDLTKLNMTVDKFREYVADQLIRMFRLGMLKLGRRP